MKQIDKALEQLKKGSIIIFPTETVFGIGCKLSSEEGIKKLYQIKKRELGKPTSVVVKNLDQAKRYAVFNPAAETLAKKFWPGPLTLILKAKAAVPESIQANGTVGLRQPSHPLLLRLLEQLDEPILAPSANFAGEAPATRLVSVDSRLKAMVDYVVDDESGGEKPSTVIDLTKTRPSFLREGPIESWQIEEALGGSFG